MELIRGLHNLQPPHRGSVATIGNFDGVHRGHQAILDQLRSHANLHGLSAVVVIFEPQPREYFAGDQAPPRLTRLGDKVRLLARYGADRVLCLPFNQRLRELSGREFIDRVLVQGLGVKHLVVGDDFRFGCDRAGDFSLLRQVGELDGFGVEHTRTFTLDGERVSSSRVRTLLASGNFRQAARLLGRPYALHGRVVKDRQLGRTIGVPTANVPLLPGALVLKGVYAVATRLDDGRILPGVANIGWRPTVGATRPVLEVHLLDADEALYGRRIDVWPCARLRGEIAFNGLEALTRQIKLDIVQARDYFRAADFQTVLARGPVTSFQSDPSVFQDNFSAVHDSLPLASAPLAADHPPTDHDDG
ncbi:bifunctional riboflavin kinase/FAD synthetase [Phytohalomonas tamaricis]|uniref:bifunctional riboflavin kinase/FAD synthetase n=1 Tax=Phytohalomonas tamaricis TaxID=2081032 RepID=UPI000D0B6B82|nr:bifunctional riboflavin kinase/FAD synthetase [Phytohalomonas tamaricis]